jgi:hypothetical protein
MTDICWTTENVLNKCSTKANMTDRLDLKAWFPKGYVRAVVDQGLTWAPRNECHFKNVASSLRNCSTLLGSFTETCIPDDSSCDQVSKSATHCKPLVGFGMDVNFGADDVIFQTNCAFEEYRQPVKGSVSRFMLDAGLGSVSPTLQNVVSVDVPYENCMSPSSFCKTGYLLRNERVWDNHTIEQRSAQKVIYKRRLRPPRLLRSLERSDENLEALLLLDVNRAATCPSLGNRGPTVNAAACGISDVADCSYPVDAIVGGCDGRGCVNQSLDKFFGRVRGFMNPSGQPKSALVRWYENDAEPGDTILSRAQMVERNKAFAMLVEGARLPGKCGGVGPTKSCMAALQTSDCLKISRFATEVQTESGVLYDALKKLSTVCFAEASAT